MGNSIFFKLFDLWCSVQTDLNKSIRWSKYIRRNKKLRKQSSLFHEYSVTVVVDAVLPILKEYNPELDELLVLRAFVVHDQPEGFSKKSFDCLVTEKTQEKDLKEYVLFREFYKYLLPVKSYLVQERAYLLQYALKENDLFPRDAMEVMDYIKKNNFLEAKIFGALESWEYIFYAYECYKHHKDDYILTQVLRRNLPILQDYTLKIKGFREEIFTQEFEKWMKDFISDHSHVPND